MLVLSLSLLDTVWTQAFLALVLAVNALHLHLNPSVPSRFNKVSSWLLSVTTATLVGENLSRRERGWDTERSREEKNNIRKFLSVQSALNLCLFVGHGTLVCLLIKFQLILTNTNNILTDSQILSLYHYILLPLAAVNLFSCLSMILPVFIKDIIKENIVQYVSTAFNICLFLSTIIIPIMSGIYLVPSSPSHVFVLVKGRDSLSIYPATTYSNYSWDLNHMWSFDNETNSIKYHNREFFFFETNETDTHQRLSLSKNLTDHDRNYIFNSGNIHITYQINPIDWKSHLFRYFQEILSK